MTNKTPSSIFDEEDERLNTELNAEAHNAQSVYNIPGYKPVRHELKLAPISISGALPSDLEGVYLRNGTNIQFDKTNIRSHAFCGAGMIHQVEIKDGIATYSNFYVRNPRFEIERKAGREIFIDFTDIAGGGPPTLRKLQRINDKKQRGVIPNLSQYELTTGSTSIRYHGGQIYCLQEQGYAFVLNTRQEDGRLVMDGTGNLETWDGEWEGPFSAHPRFDPETEDMYNLSIDATSSIIAGRITNGLRHSQVSVSQHTTGKPLAWLHDFFLTNNYLIFPDISMRLDPQGLQQSGGSVFHFDKDYPMRWGVIPRQFKYGDVVKFFETKNAAVVWHVINAWERTASDGSAEIVLFSPCFSSYPSTVPIHTPEEPPAQVKKWVLNLHSGLCTEEKLLIDHGYERPSLNLDFVGRQSRYCYLLDEHGDGYMGKGILKYDMTNEREVSYLDYGEMYGGEALFVSRKHPKDEDDGYLMDLLMADEVAELVIVDAKTMKEVSRLRLPQRVPFGVHATWLGASELRKVAAKNKG